jgi:DNA repair ATPase RecN
MSATRVWWEELRTRLDQESRAMKQSQEAVLALEQAYRALSDDEKQIVNGVLREWLASKDAGKRYDARYLVRSFRIVQALPALKELATRLSHDPASSARYELKRIDEIIQEIAHDQF